MNSHLRNPMHCSRPTPCQNFLGCPDSKGKETEACPSVPTLKLSITDKKRIINTMGGAILPIYAGISHQHSEQDKAQGENIRWRAITKGRHWLRSHVPWTPNMAQRVPKYEFTMQQNVSLTRTCRRTQTWSSNESVPFHSGMQHRRIFTAVEGIKGSQVCAKHPHSSP